MDFLIAEHIVQITFAESPHNSMDLLPSFIPFQCTNQEIISRNGFTKPLLSLHVDDSIAPAKDKEFIGDFEIGDGRTKVWRLPDGGYQFIIVDLAEHQCCLLKTDKQFSKCQCALKGNQKMRRFGLGDAVMFVFAFASSFKQTLLIHASTILYQGFGYPFIAKSGTGKSTHSQLWIENISGAELMNDDNPIIRIVDGIPYICGSPWSGKTPCYRQIKAPLGAITRIERALENSIKQLEPVSAFASFLPSCSAMKWDHDIYNAICDTITHIVENVPVYTLHCLPNADAAKICHDKISHQ